MSDRAGDLDPPEGLDQQTDVVSEVMRAAAQRRRDFFGRGDDTIVDATEAAAFLSLTKEQLDEAVRSGKLPSHVESGQRVVRVRDVRAYLESLRQQAEGAAAGYTQLRADLDLDDDIPQS